MTDDSIVGLSYVPPTEMVSEFDDVDGSRCRWLMGPPPASWSDFVLSEWELRGIGWSDLHPHDETNVVVEGELHVECEGETVVVGVGGTVRVPAGKLGRYSAPGYARMIAIYGPNPTGAKTEYGEYWEIPSDEAPAEEATWRSW
jgi:Cupin domain